MIWINWITLSIAVMAILLALVAIDRSNKAINKSDCLWKKHKELQANVTTLDKTNTETEKYITRNIKSLRDSIVLVDSKVKKLNLKVFSNKAEKDAHTNGVTNSNRNIQMVEHPKYSSKKGVNLPTDEQKQG